MESRTEADAALVAWVSDAVACLVDNVRSAGFEVLLNTCGARPLRVALMNLLDWLSYLNTSGKRVPLYLDEGLAPQQSIRCVIAAAPELGRLVRLEQREGVAGEYLTLREDLDRETLASVLALVAAMPPPLIWK